MIHEDYVTFEQAQKLKQLGFDWECNHYYHLYDEQDTLSTLSKFENSNKFDKNWSAPTLAQAQKWLREVKGIIIIPHVIHVEDILKYDFYIYGELLDIECDFEGFNTYEFALSEGINKALNFLKEQENG